MVGESGIPLDEIAHYIRNLELEYDVTVSIALAPTRGPAGGVVWNITMVALTGLSWPSAQLVEPWRTHWPNGRHRSMTSVFYRGVLELEQAVEAQRKGRRDG